MRRRVNSYTDDFKFKVVEEYLKTNASMSELQNKYGIKAHGCISNWICKFGLGKPTSEQIELQNAMKQQREQSTREKELELKVKQLEKDLEKERLKTLALNTMIDIAERDLKIKVRKNSGAKQ